MNKWKIKQYTEHYTTLYRILTIERRHVSVNKPGINTGVPEELTWHLSSYSRYKPFVHVYISTERSYDYHRLEITVFNYQYV